MTDVLQPSAAGSSPPTPGPATSAATGPSASSSARPEGIPTHLTVEEYLTWDHEDVRVDWLWRDPLPTPDEAMGELPA